MTQVDRTRNAELALSAPRSELGAALMPAGQDRSALSADPLAPRYTVHESLAVP
jgi:hypothetical protein